MLSILLPRADGPRPQDAGGHAGSGGAEPAIQRMILMVPLSNLVH